MPVSIKITVNGSDAKPLRVVVNEQPAVQGNLQALLYEASVNAQGALRDIDPSTVTSVVIDVQVPAPVAKPPTPKSKKAKK